MCASNIHKYFLIFVFLIVLPLLTIGCLSTKHRLSTLRKDNIEQEYGYRSASLWRLRIVDRTKDFKGFSPSFSFLSNAKYGVKISNSTDKWHEENNVSYYDGIFSAQAKPGYHLLSYIHLPRNARSYLSIPNKIKWDTPPGKLIYLGTFDVEVIKREGREYIYTLKANHDQSDMESTINVFQGRFPALYERLKNNIDSAVFYLHYENFDGGDHVFPGGASMTSAKGWINRRNDPYLDSYPYQDEYVVEPKDDKCWISPIPPHTKDLPENYDIELESSWRSGVKDQSYGLFLGIDSNNYYKFVVSGTGYSSIQLSVDGKWQPDPIGWKENTAIKGNGVTKNLHRVEVRSDTFTYYVNDKLIGKAQNILNFKNEWIFGMTVCSKEKVAFDNLKIIQR